MSIENYLNQHFGVSEQQITEWKTASTQQNESLILYVLKNKKINPQEYADWAFKQYKLPRLKIGFFKKHKLDQTLFDRYHNIWPDHVFPIKEWKGVLYLACLEPVENIDLPQESQWVLAPIEGILLFKESIARKDPPDILQTLDEPKPPADSLGLDNSLSSNSSSASSVNEIDFSQMVVRSSKPKSPPESEPQKENKVPLKTPKIEKASQKPLFSSSLLKKKQPASSSVPLSQPLSVSTSKLSHPSQTSSSAVKLSPSLNKPISVKPLSKSPTQSPPLVKNPLVNVKKKPSLVISNPSHIKDISKANHQHLDSQQNVFDEILNCLTKMFDQSMILIFKNTVLKPWKWDKSWSKQPSTHNIILLNKPSIFQIVYKTKQKYHGYVVPNPVNDTFFQTWNQGRYPEHLTLLPLIKKEVIKGILLGMTSKEKGKALSLDKLDLLALESSEKLAI